jgi:glutamate dehydrogenase (NAD(P)+)
MHRESRPKSSPKPLTALWLRMPNPYHRFGRLERRYTHDVYEGFAGQIESMTGKKMDKKTREFLTSGSGELELVKSGLEETMMTAYENIREVWKGNKKIEDLRTAAFVTALSKVGNDYMNLGIFP